MAVLWTIPITIEYGDISVYLKANDQSKGTLFSPRVVQSPAPAKTIQMITDALRWGYEGGTQTDQSLRAMANYDRWLMGTFGQQAVVVANGSGGGSVVPPGGVTIKSPIPITGNDFANATEWNGVNDDGINILASYTLQVYWNDIPRYLVQGTDWERTGSGIEILIPGFDATTTNLDSLFYISISI